MSVPSIDSAFLNNAVGYPTIGIFFATIFYGVSCAQVCFYAGNYTKDPYWLKGLVATIWVADTLKEISCIQVLWSLLIRHHGSRLAFVTTPNAYCTEQVVDKVVSYNGIYYIYIGWKLGSQYWYNRMLCTVAVLLSIGSLALVSAAMYFVQQGNAAGLGKLTIAINVLSVLTDVYITTSLCFVFHSARIPQQPSLLQSDHVRSKGILSKLTMYTANRGIIICAHQTLLLATYIWDLKTGTAVTDIFSFSRGSLYFNAFLAVLNARHHIKESGMVASTASMAVPSVARQNQEDK